MTQHCTITGTMLVPVHYIICTLKIVCFPEITVFVVVKINSFQCQCQCQYITVALAWVMKRFSNVTAILQSRL